jgi:hypothetical protein
LPDSAFIGENAVEEDESHPAVQVDKNHADYEDKQAQEDDPGEEKDAAFRRDRPLQFVGRLRGQQVQRKPNTPPSALAHFAGKETHERQPKPLSKPERFEQVFHSLECRVDNINGRKGHVYPPV